jgi:hypothetical protein
VDLRGTQRYPLGFLISDTQDGQDTYVEVPPDDYRAIRRAILNVSEYLNQGGSH